MGPVGPAAAVDTAGDQKKGACDCDAAAAAAAAEAGCLLVDHGDIAVARPTRVILLLPGDSSDEERPADDDPAPRTNPPAGASRDGAGLKDRCRDSEAQTAQTGQSRAEQAGEKSEVNL